MLYYKVYNDTDDISIIKNTFMKISYPFTIIFLVIIIRIIYKI